MAGLLGGNYNPDPLAQGLLGLGAALMTPRQLGGGLMAGAQAFNQQAMLAQEMKRRMAADAERAALLKERTAMDREEFGFKRQQYQTAQEEAQRRQQVLGQVRSQIEANNPELLPLFDTNPQAAMERLFPKPEESKVVAPGSRVVRGNQEIYAAPDRPPQMPWEYELGPDGQPRMKPGVFQSKRELARAGATNVNTPVQILQEREESKVVGAGMGKTFLEIQNAGLQARSKVNNLSRLETLLSGYETGKLTPLGKEIASYAASVGINIDKNLGNKEAAESLSNELALQARNPSGGAGMPGAMSDQDRAFLQNMVPNLSKSAGGNRTIIETQRRLARREMDVARIASEYRAKNGTLDPQFYQQLQQWADANPLFADMPAASAGAQSPQSVSGRVGQPSVNDLLKKYGNPR